MGVRVFRKTQSNFSQTGQTEPESHNVLLIVAKIANSEVNLRNFTKYPNMKLATLPIRM